MPEVFKSGTCGCDTSGESDNLTVGQKGCEIVGSDGGITGGISDVDRWGIVKGCKQVMFVM